MSIVHPFELRVENIGSNDPVTGELAAKKGTPTEEQKKQFSAVAGTEPCMKCGAASFYTARYACKL